MKTVCACKHVNVHMNVYMYVCVVCACVCMRVWAVCVCICVCVCGVCVCICVYTCVCVYAGAIACTQMCEYQRSMPSVFLYPSPFYFLRQVSFLTLNSLVQLDCWLVTFRDIPACIPPCWGYRRVPLTSFCGGARIHTQVLTLLQQALYPLNHLPIFWMLEFSHHSQHYVLNSWNCKISI